VIPAKAGIHLSFRQRFEGDNADCTGMTEQAMQRPAREEIP
jgi:hypothetical protein